MVTSLAYLPRPNGQFWYQNVHQAAEFHSARGMRGPENRSALALRHRRALGLEAGAAGLGGEAALPRAGAWRGLPAQAGRGGGALDQCDEAGERVFAVAFL